MNLEDVKIKLDGVLALVQLVTEDIESSFFDPELPEIVKSRAALDVNALYAVSGLLQNLIDNAE